MSKRMRCELKNAWDDPVKATLIQRRILDEKILLRQWYEGIYSFITKNLKKGTVNVELGSGTSFLYRHIQGLVKTNIIVIPDNTMAFDAYAMPFKKDSIDNLILISVFHHLNDPQKFLLEAMRVLKPEGRILISDPYVSFLSYIWWNFFHPERCDLSKIGFDKNEENNPLVDANSANATLMFAPPLLGAKRCFLAEGAGFKVLTIVYHTIFHYWLAGGYNLPSLAPKWALGIINLAEKILRPFGRFLASFMFVVIKKKEETCV